MNTTRSLIALTLLFAATFPTDGYAQQTYPLLCRGGGTMKSQSHPGDTQHTYNILGLFFTKGARPAGAGLSPGECSWYDRGMNSKEPDILQQKVGKNVTSAPWSEALKNPSTYWIFDVFNSGQGVLEITGNRPKNGID